MDRILRLLLITLCGVAAADPRAARGSTPAPRYDHVVIVIMANKSAGAIYGNFNAAYINETLIPGGARFTSSYAVASPDEPDYLALFSGSTQGTIFNTCPVSATGTNLAQQLFDASLTFAQYSEGLGTAGSTACSNGLYTRTHNPVPDFPLSMVDSAVRNRDFSDFAGALSGATLPTVSFVVPNLCNDMHGSASCSTNLIALGDQWLQNFVPPYFASSSGKNGLLIVTWDQDDSTPGNNNLIPTIFFGPHVKSGFVENAVINHYSILRTIEDMYGLTALGGAATAAAITDIWDDTIYKNGFE